MRKINDYLKHNILKIEIICLFLVLFFSAVLQIAVLKLDFTSLIPWEWLHKLYRWITVLNMSDLLEEIDKLAIIVGGLSFLAEKWTEKDTENIVYMIVMVLSLVLSKIFHVFNMHIISFSLLCINILFISIPISFIIYDSLIDSRKQDEKRSKIV